MTDSTDIEKTKEVIDSIYEKKKAVPSQELSFAETLLVMAIELMQLRMLRIARDEPNRPIGDT